MKKIFALLLMLIMSIGSTFANTIVFSELGLENGTQYLDPFDGGNFTVTFAGGVNDGKYYTTGAGIRVYGNGTMTITAKSGNITEITVTYDGSNKPTTADVVNVGTYNPSTGVWTGSSQSVVFTRPSGSGHWRVKSIDVATTSGVSVSTPTISGTTPFNSSTEVFISCTTAGASIYYTTDGSDPDNTSTQYDGQPIIIKNTTTIKAIGYKENTYSNIAQKEFVKRTSVNSISELFGLQDGTEFVFNGQLTCIWQHGQYLYTQEGNASYAGNSLLIYGTIDNDYNITEIIPSGWVGKKTTYANLTEVRDASGFGDPIGYNRILETELDLTDLSSSDVGKYVVVKNSKIILNTQPQGNTVVFDFNNGLSDLGLETPETGTGTNLENSITYQGVTMNFTNGGTATRIWNSSGTTTLRVYKNGGSLTFVSSVGNFTEIAFDGTISGTFDTGTMNWNTKHWTGNASSVTVTISSNSTINKITFTFGNTPNNISRAQQINESFFIEDIDGNQITAYPQKLGGVDIPDDLTQRYDTYGILDTYNGNYQLLPLGFIDENGIVTTIDTVIDNEIKTIKYYNTQGMTSNKPFDGFNIIVVEYMNGEMKTIKQIYKF